jgi:cellulose synthase/poly-beta-1,6-N-acetylglucosamine synthase-like glycosyltransferase
MNRSADLEPSRTSSFEFTLGLVSLNEERTIGSAVKAVIGEMSGVSSELILVVGGTDRTVAVAAESIKNVDSARLIEDSSPKGKPAALNALFSEARGRIVVLSDGDVLVQRGALHHLGHAFEDERVGGASGRVIGAQTSFNAIQKACDLMTEMMHVSRMRTYEKSGSLDLASGYLIAIRRELVPVLPLDASSDDGYLSLSVRSQGYNIAYVDKAVVSIKYPRTLSDFLKQKSRTRYGHLQLARGFPSMQARTANREMSEYIRMVQAARSRRYGIHILALAAVLTGLSWISAHLTMRFPWLLARKVWKPIPSTK